VPGPDPGAPPDDDSAASGGLHSRIRSGISRQRTGSAVSERVVSSATVFACDVSSAIRHVSQFWGSCLDFGHGCRHSFGLLAGLANPSFDLDVGEGMHIRSYRKWFGPDAGNGSPADVQSDASGRRGTLMPQQMYFVDASRAALDGVDLGRLAQLQDTPRIGEVPCLPAESSPSDNESGRSWMTSSTSAHAPRPSTPHPMLPECPRMRPQTAPISRL
jgi:hypothetical protein